MPAPPDSSTPARAALQRAERLLAGVPAGPARLLFQPLLLVQERADPLVAVVLAGMGAEVLALAPEQPAWDGPRDRPRFAALAALLEQERPGLDATTAHAIGPSTIHAALRYTLRTPPDDWTELRAHGPFPTVLVDGLRALRADARARLRVLHGLLPVGGVLELVAGPDEAATAAELDALRADALACGFGVRHAACALGDPGAEHEPALVLGLVALAEPLSEHPSNAYVDARRASRLDLATALVEGQRVLDAGGGEGVGARRYLEAGARAVTMIDVDPATLAAARARLGDDARVTLVAWDLDATPYPFDDGSFDVVICLEALEHIDAQAAAVAELHRVLAPGGQLLVSVPEAAFEADALRANTYGNPYHRHVPTREELARLLEPFAAVHWFRQLDAVGTVTLPDDPRGARPPRTRLDEGWDPARTRPEVIGALCVKAAPGRARGPARATIARRLTSDLHVFGDASSSLLELRLEHARLEQRFLEQRFAAWCDGNAQRARLAAAQAQLAALEARADERAGALQEQLGRERARAEALATQCDEARTALEAAREQLEHERRRADDERAALLERLGARTTQQIERLERRCLEAESRLWDLEEPPAESARA